MQVVVINYFILERWNFTGYYTIENFGSMTNLLLRFLIESLTDLRQPASSFVMILWCRSFNQHNHKTADTTKGQT